MEKTVLKNDEIIQGMSLGELQERFRTLRALSEIIGDIAKATGTALESTHQALLDRMDTESMQSIQAKDTIVPIKEMLEPLREAVKTACEARSADGKSIVIPKKTLFIKSMTFASLLEANRTPFFRALKNLGSGDAAMIVRTINANTLSAWVRKVDTDLKAAAQAKREGMPYDKKERSLNKKRKELIDKYLTTYPKRSINVR